MGDNGRKYDNIQRSKAIAALEESCRVVKGELKPHFREVERLRGMPGKTTLRRWWRDHQEDEEKRRKNQQNRGASGSGASQNRPHLSARYEERERAAALEGVRLWHEEQIRQVRAAVAWILSPQHREGDNPIRPDQMARALRDIGPVLQLVGPSSDPAEGRQTHSARIARVKAAAARVGLSTTTKGR